LARVYRVEFEYPDGQVRCAPIRADEHVLDGARRAGLVLPSACEQGWDLACACRISVGEPLDQSDSRRYFAEDRDAGFALICTGRPRSDLRLLTHRTEEMRRNRDAQGLPAPRGTWGLR